MDKNSLILEIKNDLNSIKKQVEVTLAKLAVLESMIELDKKLGVSVAEPVEAQHSATLQLCDFASLQLSVVCCPLTALKMPSSDVIKQFSFKATRLHLVYP